MAEPPGGDEPLVTADDSPVVTAGEDRLDEAELAQAPLERVELLVADAPGVRRVGSEVVDRHLLDGEGAGSRGHRMDPPCICGSAE